MEECRRPASPECGGERVLKQRQYSFHNIDSIYDFLLSIGMKPFIELGFMPA